jgi:hypothetical protein
VRTIAYEHQAAAALDTARALYPRVEHVITALEWLLARDDNAGLPLVAGGRLRLLVFKKAASIRVPAIECLFEYQAEKVIIHDLEFT